MAPKINGFGIMPEDTRICVVMVGLPARGKSYIAQRGESAAIHPSICLGLPAPLWTLHVY